jgi:uncharacterized protein (TIGR03118 family)
VVDGRDDGGADILAVRGCEQWVIQAKWSGRNPIGWARLDDCETARTYYGADRCILQRTLASTGPSPSAKQDAALHDDVAGQGNGFVDVFTNDGALVRRLVTRGQLNSPWRLALAPADFGQFSGDLLVGNFGDGHINVYNPDNGARLGQLRQANGQPVVVDGLWGLRFGNGNAAKTNELLFSAGPDGESNGLLGKIVTNS